MLYEIQCSKRMAAALLVLLFVMMRPALAAADYDFTRLTEEVERRVEEMDAAIAEAAAEENVAEMKLDVTAIPGRESFIPWALSALASLEKGGYITSDEVFLAEAGPRPPRASNCCPAAALLFESLGRLRATDAVPVLSRFMLMEGRSDGICADRLRVWWEAYPACIALAAIGEPSLGAVVAKARDASHPRLIKLCGWVVGAILGEEGPDWLDEQIRLENDPVARASLEALRDQVNMEAMRARWTREAAEKQAAVSDESSPG
ncbi:MAG: hypothetical protein ACYTAN_16385, partial [Planctomycetota bacterium]